MMDFFEMLNGCSPMRATGYMGFILLVMFFTYVFLEGVITGLFSGKESNEEDGED